MAVLTKQPPENTEKVITDEPTERLTIKKRGDTFGLVWVTANGRGDMKSTAKLLNAREAKEIMEFLVVNL